MPTIACSRPLPVSQVPFDGGMLRLVHVAPGADVPGDAVAYLAAAVDPIDAGMIAQMPDGLGLIANLGVGFDNIDRAAAARRGILVSNTPVVAEDTADLAFALLLAACRQLGRSERYLREGAWAAGRGAPPIGMRVNGATLGIVGFGAIGQAVARRAAGFGMHVLYHGPREKPEGAALGAQYRASLHDLLGQSDIVTLHAALNDDTRAMIGAAELAACKPGMVLINTGRGALIDQPALIGALAAGDRIAGAGLDVFTGEPEVPEALIAMENVVLTPHIGSATAQCRKDMFERAMANIIRFVQTGTVIDAVPPPPA